MTAYGALETFAISEGNNSATAKTTGLWIGSGTYGQIASFSTNKSQTGYNVIFSAGSQTLNGYGQQNGFSASNYNCVGTTANFGTAQTIQYFFNISIATDTIGILVAKTILSNQ